MKYSEEAFKEVFIENTEVQTLFIWKLLPGCLIKIRFYKQAPSFANLHLQLLIS
jgi:hypothetical protein